MTEYKDFYRNALVDNLSLNLISIGRKKMLLKSGILREIENTYVIHYIFSGKGTLSFDGGSVKLNKGDLFITYPMTNQTYVVDIDNPWEYFWIKISGKSANELMNKTLFTKDKPYYTATEDLSPFIYDIIESQGHLLTNRLELIGKMYVFLSKIIVNPTSEENSYLNDALQYIADFYNQGINVSNIAEHLGISRDYLYKIFMQNIKISPSDHLTFYKINESMQLLSKGDMNISQISEIVGFYDQYHFSKTFKKVVGKTPAQYRKDLLKDKLSSGVESNAKQPT